MLTVGSVVIDQSAAITAITPKIQQSMPDSEALDPVSGKSHFKKAIQAHQACTTYLTAHAKFMVPQEQQPNIPIENVESSNKPADHVPETTRRGLKAIKTTRRPSSIIGQKKSLRKPTR